MQSRLSRRHFLQFTSAAAATACAAGPGLLLGAEPTKDARPGPTRFVHLTDIHVQPERRAEKGLVKCLNAVMQLDPQPQFILTGGDLVMDVFKQDSQRAKLLFTLLRKVFADHAGVPVYHCIGNHDVFAWGNKKVAKDAPLYGKQMVSEYLNLPNRYYRFDQGGWRFYVLDDIQPAADNTYQAYIDKAQLAWLEKELRAKPPEMPAAAVCHIPILSVTTFGKVKRDAYRVPVDIMCRGVRRLVDLFAKHNVRLALSGHTHDLDRIDYRGTTFICDGAVCGAWWKGPHRGVQEGFGVLDVRPDGAVEHRYFDYGWEV